MSSTSNLRRSVDPDVDDTFEPDQIPLPSQRCSVCHDLAGFHEWMKVPEAELALPYERSAYRLICHRCQATKRAHLGCCYTAETNLVA